MFFLRHRWFLWQVKRSSEVSPKMEDLHGRPARLLVLFRIMELVRASVREMTPVSFRLLDEPRQCGCGFNLGHLYLYVVIRREKV